MPKVKLITWTQDPIETIYTIWQSGKTLEPVMSIKDVKAICKTNKEFKAEVLRTFKAIIHSKIPIAENLNFTFVLSDVSIALREQLVRHRIGTKLDDKIGVDMIPNLADSTFWAQSMRLLPMDKFFSDNAYYYPEGLKDKVVTDECGMKYPAGLYYEKILKQIQTAYSNLIKAGVGFEDARMLLPLATTHRIVWTLNLSSLMHVIGKRSCWISQATLWNPIIEGMIEEICNKVSNEFRELATPPCIKNDKFQGCIYTEINKERCENKDDNPPCSLYVRQNKAKWLSDSIRKSEKANELIKKYTKLWNRNSCTGEKL